MKRIILGGLLFLSACATPPGVREEPAVVAVPEHKPWQMIVFVPQSDAGAASWLKWFTRHPALRMVIAVSPRFQRWAKDPAMKAQVAELQQAGRLELALQIPNAPILPLLIDTNAARDTLPVGAPLPSPPYAYPDDVLQQVAQAKAAFFKQWNFSPRGVVIPHGAVNPPSAALLGRLGFTWALGAMGAPPVGGPYQTGSLRLWDAAPSGPSPNLIVHVWDERHMKSTTTMTQMLERWVQDQNKRAREPILPSDTTIVSAPLPDGLRWGGRTWTALDWSAWIGHPAKNAAWAILRKTREALEGFKNSGRASVQRLDMAFTELSAAQSSGYLAAFGNAALSPAVVEEREHEFQATVSTVFRLMDQAPPDDLFKGALDAAPEASSTMAEAQVFADGRERVFLGDATGDDRGADGLLDLQSVEVWGTRDEVTWTVALRGTEGARVDIYVDLNNQANVGTIALLPGRGLSAAAADAWEYALTLTRQGATLYRTRGDGTFGTESQYPVTATATTLQTAIPRAAMRGSPRRWGYQVLVMADHPDTPLRDLLDPAEITQADWLRAITSRKRSDVPFVRIRKK